MGILSKKVLRYHSTPARLAKHIKSGNTKCWIERDSTVSLGNPVSAVARLLSQRGEVWCHRVKLAPCPSLAIPGATFANLLQKAYMRMYTAELLRIKKTMKITKISINNTMENKIWCHHAIKLYKDEKIHSCMHQHEWTLTTQREQEKSYRTYTVRLYRYIVQKTCKGLGNNN